MNNFFDYIINFGFLKISVLNLILTSSVIFFTFIFSFVLKKILLREKLQKYVVIEIRNKITSFLIIISWLIAISIIIEINTYKFYDYQFIKNKYIEIKTITILSAIFTITLNLIIIYLFKIVKNKITLYNENTKNIALTSFKLIQIILWLIALNIVLKSILINYSKFLEFDFFSISKTPITVGNVIFGGIIIVIGQLILLAINVFFKRQVNHKKLDIGTSYSIYRIIKYIIWIILAAIILEGAGFELSILLAGSAALLVGLGFGVQQLFSDFVSGFVLIAEGTLKVGDIIEIDGQVGKVIASNLRTTEVLTVDNERIIIPNTRFTSDNIINKTKNDNKTRFHISVGVAYGSDIELVEKLLIESTKKIEGILKKPEPFVLFTNFGDSSLDFQVLFWSKKEFSIELIKSNIRKSIDKKFRQNNITIPFPQTDVHLFQK